MIYLGHQEVDLLSQLLINSCVYMSDKGHLAKTSALLVTQLETLVKTGIGPQAYVCSVSVPYCAQHWDF